MLRKSQYFSSILALMALAITFSLAVCAQAQTVTNLATFDGQNGHDPVGSIVQATDGNFYGTTFTGGTNDQGSVYQLTRGGKLTSIYSFCSQPNCTDGKYPIPALVLGSDANLYGVTDEGGSNAGFSDGAGVFYKMTLGGKITVLYTFCSSAPCSDGQAPVGLLLGNDGNFYGATYAGGTFNAGTIFAISPTGKIRTVYSFCSQANCLDGQTCLAQP